MYMNAHIHKRARTHAPTRARALGQEQILGVGVSSSSSLRRRSSLTSFGGGRSSLTGKRTSLTSVVGSGSGRGSMAGGVGGVDMSSGTIANGMGGAAFAVSQRELNERLLGPVYILTLYEAFLAVV